MKPFAEVHAFTMIVAIQAGLPKTNKGGVLL